jgi:hypothetical protein
MSEGGESDALAILDGLEEAITQLDPVDTQLRSAIPIAFADDRGTTPPPRIEAFAAEPFAAEPFAAEPVTAEPFTAEPVTAEPFTASSVSVANVPAPPPVAKPLALRRYPDPAPRPAGVKPTVASCAAVLERFHWGESR